VILISLDGFRVDYLDRHETPVLDRLASKGVRAQWLIPSFPTLTYPNHYAMLTGRYPDHDGIVDNYMDDPAIPGRHFGINNFKTIDDARWWSEAIPLWVTLKRAGGRTAELDWPGADIVLDGTATALQGSRNEPEIPALRADTVTHWLGLPGWERPRLTLVHFELTDAIGHIWGPDSPRMNAALRSVDAAVGQIVHALKSDGEYGDTDIIVLSDHGMAAVQPDQIIYLDDLIDISGVDLVTQDALAGMNPLNTVAGRVATATLLRPHAHMHCWHRQDLPAHLHYGANPRVPRIECLADPGWIIETHRFALLRPFPLRGDHGYDNAAPSMRAVFIAEGPSFRRGYVAPPFPNVDVYPLVAHLLNLVPESGDGSLGGVAGMLRPRAGRL
jgi:predicted AlkP superfamily pyrophosphatase or phosphodiesterase